MDHHRDNNLNNDFDTNESWETIPGIRNMPIERQTNQRRSASGHKPKRDPQAVKTELAAQQEAQIEFDFSYHASRHERQWIIDSLGGFYEDHWLDDVLRLLQGGKEANVYQCAANPNSIPGADYLAAKVYRPRQFRNLKNDHLYREGRANLDSEGRVILDDRMNHAMQKRTRYGLELLHSSWIEHEFQTMLRLYGAGADVPAPYARGHNAILMEYIGYDDLPAPALQEISLSPLEAKQLFERVVHNLDVMLAQERIHGDLSAFNILYLDGEITLIDFPQSISPETNPNAFRIFERDVVRVCEYFTEQGYERDGHRLAAQLWRQHHLRRYPKFDLRMLDAEDPQDRRYWRMVSQEK